MIVGSRGGRIMKWFVVAAVLAAGLALSGAVPGARAHESDGHPARIQKGSCENLGGVAYRLTGVGAAITADGTPVPTPEAVGSPDAVPVQVSETTLGTTLSALAKEPHAVVVYESDEAMDHLIACGNIGGLLTAQMPGMVMPGDVLAIWLAGENDSGYVGAALLEAAGTEATLRVFLSQGLQGHATPEAGYVEEDEHGAEATPHTD